MKKKITVLIIILLGLALLISGAVFAISSPFPLVPPAEGEHLDIEEALKAYLLERATLALDDYPGEGELAISLEAPGFSQFLANSFSAQAEDVIPKNLKFRGAFSNFTEKGITVGGGFKYLFLPLAVSVQMQAELQEGALQLQIESVRLGRIPLPLKLFTKLAGRFLEESADLTSLSLDLPLADNDWGFAITALNLEPEQAVIHVLIPDTSFLEIDEEVLQNLEEIKPQVEPILENNPRAMALLEEIETLLNQAKESGKPVNVLRIKNLAEDFYEALSPEEINQLEAVVDKDTLDYIRQLTETP